MRNTFTFGTRRSRKHRVILSPRVATIEDLRAMARRRLPKVIFDYIDGGAEGEMTLRENQTAFQELSFRPRHGIALPDCNLHTRVLDCDLSMPVLLAPVAYSGVFHSGGELAAARAASKAGTVYILPTLSGQRIEDI